MTYAVRAGKGVEVRYTLCGPPLGLRPRDTRTVRTLSADCEGPRQGRQSLCSIWSTSPLPHRSPLERGDPARYSGTCWPPPHAPRLDAPGGPIAQDDRPHPDPPLAKSCPEFPCTVPAIVRD